MCDEFSRIPCILCPDLVLLNGSLSQTLQVKLFKDPAIGVGTAGQIFESVLFVRVLKPGCLSAAESSI